MKTLGNVLLAFALVALALVVGVLGMLAAWSLLPVELAPPAGKDIIVFWRVFPALPLGGLLVFWLSHRKAWKVLAGLAALAGIVLVWLAWDEPATVAAGSLTNPAPLPERHAESDAVVRWYWTADERPPTRKATWPQLPLAKVSPNSSGTWRLYVASHREEIRSAWEGSTDLWAWFQALDRFEIIGDTFTPLLFGQHPTQRSAFYAAHLYCAYASLLAVDGRGDEAFTVLAPLLSVARKLQAGARTHERFFPAMRAQRNGQAAAQFILRGAPVSAAALRHLATVLQPGEPPDRVGRRILQAYFIQLHGFFSDHDAASMPFVLKLLGRCVVNRRATEALLSRQFDRLIAVAAEGRAEGLRAHQAALQREVLAPSFKNAVGRFLVAMMLDDVSTFVLDGWRIDDQRRALLAEVQAKLAELEKQPAAQPPTTAK